MKRSFELLSPAGTWDAFIAAVNNGADAVYLGGKLFNARSSAANFDLNEIAAAVKYAETKNVNIYVTVNTLVADAEIHDVLKYVGELYQTGVDAVILQDMGLASLLRDIYPNLPLHASTQMTVHNTLAAKFLQEMGFKRIIAERQMTLSELIKLREEIDIELEVFAHGALCISYSGQCLMSSMIGGRSGNRGRCAQPCRLEYDLVSQNKGLIRHEQGKHLLSTRDLNLAASLPILIENEFTGIKVEGRMKRPEYVATVTRIYREAIDRYFENPEKYHITDEEQRQLKQIFNRDFTQGFLWEENGTDLMSLKRPNNRGVHIGRVVDLHAQPSEALIKLEGDVSEGDGLEIWVTVGGRIGISLQKMKVGAEYRSKAYTGETVTVSMEGKCQIGDRVFKTYDHHLIAQAQSSYLNQEQHKRVPLKATVSFHQNKPLIIILKDDKDNEIKEISQRVGETAQNYSVSVQQLADQLERTGNTNFYIKEFEWDIEPDLFMPVSIINEMRRKAIQQFEDLYLNFAKPADLQESLVRLSSFSVSSRPSSREASRQMIPRLAVTVDEEASFKAAVRTGADIIYWGGDLIDVDQIGDIKKLMAENLSSIQSPKEICLALPRITKDKELDTIRALLIRGHALDAFRVANIGQFNLESVKDSAKICADYPLHTFNAETLEFYKELGAKRVTLSPELTIEQIEDMEKPGDIECECVIHGQIPVMVMEYCPIGTVEHKGNGHHSDLCHAECQSDQYYLKDKLGYQFPVYSNGHCRTHIMNSKELCLFDNLDELMGKGIAVVRIEASQRGSSYTEQVVSIYRHWLDRYKSNELLSQAEISHAKRVLLDLSQGGITKGHFYRGVD